MADVSGLTVIVTGSTRGIGKGIGISYSKAGAKVLFCGRNEELGEAIVTDLQNSGHVAFFLKVDVTSREDCKKMAAVALEKWGSIDVIVANAGLMPNVLLDDITDHDFDDVFNTNVKGAVLSVQACAPALRQSTNGRIILISSITGDITGMCGFSLYGATKAAMLGFMRSIALEMASSGVTVNSILPGNIVTEGLIELGEEYLKSMASSVPLKRLGSVDDIANAAVFLGSRQAGFITGQTIVVDGGQVLPESLSSL
jgi:3-oxoacyl-[acyl-carrier protein] reductase